MKLTPEVLSGLIGLVMPYAVEVVKTILPKKRWVGFSLSLLVSAGVGTLSSWIKGVLNPENILESAGVALVASQAVYNYWFKPTGQDEKVARALGK